ncbi:lysophospholipid acyltransferase family protein [Solimicrobium silvestre]|uniref:Acyltransferase n=1 Tax=Solimicrobium silvestre TaxID=2099400 RepID=A0A2S9GTT1_9BURK|nr:lysophospholipid acyltransferase family protein [Solimicrobium silvestre]PRC91108.1 Acyltransferase [Solimicrobium silvestre]
MNKLRYYLQICRVAVHLVRGLLICFLLFPWLSKEAKQSRIQIWSQQLLAVFNVRVKMNLASMPTGSVIISNHISWLDIFVINSLAPCRFVAKSDIRSWPMLGWLAEQAGTIYISRGSKSDVKRIYQYLIDQIEAGERVAFFPEGTTAAQGVVLPFHANLFEAAIHAKVPIQPFTLRYLNAAGELHHAVDFTGDMTFAASMDNILNGGEVVVELQSLEPISSIGAHRRELASAARLAVAEALQVDI